MARSPLPPEILRSLPLSEELEGEAKKERDIITSNRVKLTEYIHDVTLLFPYMKEKGVFNVDDCDIVRAEPTSTLKVDKFVDIFLTKGPRAIGVFHEALDAHYPAVFDYLAWLFTNAGVQLSPSRQLRDRAKDSQTSSLKSNHNGLISRGLSFQRGSRTVRKSLEVLSRQCEYVQRERDELQKSLISREREISSLLSSRDQFQSNLLAVTQKYQELLLELGHWRDLLSNQSEGGYKRMQELLSERESIQAEYDQLEGEFMLVSSELNAARDRISRLLNHLERSEAVVAITQEDKEKLKDKLEVCQGEIQRLHRKIERLASRESLSEASGSVGVGEGDAQSLEDKSLELQSELDKALDSNKELKERLQVAHIERREALEERDAQLSKYHVEWERRKKAERELRHLRQKQHSADTHSQLSYTSTSAISPDELTNVRPEDFTIVMPAPSSSDPGMDLGLGVVVRTVAENGLASNNGVKPGDELYQVNHINLAVDKEPLEFARRLLLSASQTVTLSIKRQVPSSVIGMQPSFSFPALSLTTTPTSPCLVNPLEQQILMQHRCSTGMLPIAEHLSLSRSQVSSTTSTSTSAKSHDDQTSGEDRGGISEDSGTEHLPPKSRDGEERRSGGNRFSAVSNQSDTSAGGLITSPTASIGHDRHRDSLIPDSITRYEGTTILGRTLPEKYEPPTCILNGHEEGGEGREGGEREEGEQLSQECDDELCSLDVNHQPPTPPRWRKRSQDSDNDSQRLQRWNKVIYRNRREKERKISRSMDDMTEVGHNDELVISPKINRKELHVNRVLLPRGQLGRGLKLVGGRGYGVFIHSHRHTSRGLQTGDQITKIGNKSVNNLTHAEVVEILHSYTHTGEQCILSLHHNMDAYSRLPSASARDDFYVRTKFQHQRKSVRSELTFEKGHIFHVVDTLPLGHVGMWRVERVGSKGEIGEIGLVPISLSPTEMMETTSTSLPRFLQNLSPKDKRRNGAHTLEEQKSQKIPAASAFKLYEPIIKVKVTEPRPVVLLGALEVDIRRYLVENGSNEEIKFSYCMREPADTLRHKNSEVIESLTNCDGIVMRSTVQHAQHVARKGYHCVLCLEPEQLIKFAVAQLCPIALLLDAKNTKTVKQIQASCNLPPERHGNPQVHLDRIKAMQKYLPCFTGEVNLPSTMKEVIQVVREMVARQQKSVMWEVEEH